MSFWQSYWFVNANFSIQLVAAVSSFVMVYVFFSTWRREKKFKLIMRLLGFLLLAIFFLTQSAESTTGFDIPSWQMIIKATAYLLIFVSFMIDPVQAIPGAKADKKEKKKEDRVSEISHNTPHPGTQTAAQPVNQDPASVSVAGQQGTPFSDVPNTVPTGAFVLPVIVGVSIQTASVFVLAFTVFRIFIKQTRGFERELKKLMVGLFFLLVSEIVFTVGFAAPEKYVVVSRLATDFGMLWIAHKVILLLGFVFIGWYAWGYLRFKMFSQIVGAFVGASLAIFVIITFVYTSLLVETMQQNSLNNLSTNLRTLGYAIELQKDQAKASAEVIASNKNIRDALSELDTAKLAMLVEDQLSLSGVDFLAVVNDSGNILTRGEDPEVLDKDMSDNIIVADALAGGGGTNMAVKEWVSAPQVLIEAAYPIDSSGAVYTGYVIDNAFVDGLKSATGLDIAVFAGDVRSATTLTGTDDTSRLIGTVETNEEVNKKVIQEKEPYLGLTSVFQQEYLSAYGPFYNFKEEVLGMFFVGEPSVTLFEAAQKSLATTFYVTGILAVLSFVPAFLLASFIEKNQV